VRNRRKSMGFTADYADEEPTRAEIDAIAGPLIVEFGASWCGYCLAAQPVLSKLLAHFPHMRHVKIHDGPGQPLGRSCQVKLWPTLVFMRDGEVLARTVRPSESEMVEGLRVITTER
jgi:thioredoxin 1